MLLRLYDDAEDSDLKALLPSGRRVSLHKVVLKAACKKKLKGKKLDLREEEWALHTAEALFRFIYSGGETLSVSGRVLFFSLFLSFPAFLTFEE